MQTERGIFITQEEKNAALLKIATDLREWRKRNPDAPRGRSETEGTGATPDPRLPTERGEEGSESWG